jgi:glycosyltransferase involved in cell wall biosynthesis
VITPESPLMSSAVPRVSLVLPVHNGANYLADAIASVVGQSFTDFELICVDDASSDKSLNILSAAAAVDNRIRLIHLDKNVGLPAALNHGFALARGSYLSWTSDDNLLRATMLEKLVEALDANPHCAIVHSDYSVIDPEGKIIDFVDTNSQRGLLLGNHIGASFLYRREVDLTLGGYDIELFGAEDFDFWLRASAHFQFLHLAEDLYLYRKHPLSLTNSRAAVIQTLNTNVILRAIPATMSRTDRAEVLLALFRRNFVHLRLDLLLKAFLYAPINAVMQLPSLGWHALRVMRARLRG